MHVRNEVADSGSGGIGGSGGIAIGMALPAAVVVPHILTTDKPIPICTTTAIAHDQLENKQHETGEKKRSSEGHSSEAAPTSSSSSSGPAVEERKPVYREEKGQESKAEEKKPPVYEGKEMKWGEEKRSPVGMGGSGDSGTSSSSSGSSSS